MFDFFNLQTNWAIWEEHLIVYILVKTECTQVNFNVHVHIWARIEPYKVFICQDIFFIVILFALVRAHIRFAD